jgi:uncharacterized protein (DUF2225 family)
LEKGTQEKMTDTNNHTIICCPFCMTPITVEELGEYVNANPEAKKQAIEEELALWGDVYDRNYLMLNVVFCPNCHKVSHFKDWGSSGKKNV